jgi:hypothetical protein
VITSSYEGLLIIFAMSNLSNEEQLKLIADLEIEMMADMYNRFGCISYIFAYIEVNISTVIHTCLSL